MRGFLVPLLFLIPLVKTDLKWSSSEYAEQAAKMSCKLLKRENSMTLPRNSRSANSTELGKVLDLETCGMLCCEVDSCDLALFENERCYAVNCPTPGSCDLVPSQETNSQVMTFTKKNGSGSNGEEGNKNFTTNYQEDKTKIVTKQAAVQKSSIPEITIVSSENRGSVLAISNKVNKVESPMDALLHKEVTMVRDKQKQKEDSAKKEMISSNISNANVGEKIQDITEHYLKAEEKSDMTALQENETSVTHTIKTKNHRRDLRHTLISPITIGAFTCMAVIAVSGFAMAIIKYQRDRKEFEDKQTQEP